MDLSTAERLIMLIINSVLNPDPKVFIISPKKKKKKSFELKVKPQLRGPNESLDCCPLNR